LADFQRVLEMEGISTLQLDIALADAYLQTGDAEAAHQYWDDANAKLLPNNAKERTLLKSLEAKIEELEAAE
jgi:hypothetical protein